MVGFVELSRNKIKCGEIEKGDISRSSEKKSREFLHFVFSSASPSERKYILLSTPPLRSMKY